MSDDEPTEWEAVTLTGMYNKNATYKEVAYAVNGEEATFREFIQALLSDTDNALQDFEELFQKMSREQITKDMQNNIRREAFKGLTDAMQAAFDMQLPPPSSYEDVIKFVHTYVAIEECASMDITFLDESGRDRFGQPHYGYSHED